MTQVRPTQRSERSITACSFVTIKNIYIKFITVTVLVYLILPWHLSISWHWISWSTMQTYLRLINAIVNNPHLISLCISTFSGFHQQVQQDTTVSVYWLSTRSPAVCQGQAYENTVAHSGHLHALNCCDNFLWQISRECVMELNLRLWSARTEPVPWGINSDHNPRYQSNE